MVTEILSAAGYLVGAFRSPHLTTYRERIAVGHEEISEQDWLDAFNLVRPVAEAMRTNALPDYRLGRPALFEILFAMACLHCAREGVEWAVMETGLGGRLDATNLLQSDVAAVTNVSLEHTQILGTTIDEIAREKAAIIKPGAAAVTAATGVEALDVIQARAESVGSPLLVVGRDIEAEVLHSSPQSQLVALRFEDEVVRATLPLGGRHQSLNAAVAFGVAVSLRQGEVEISPGNVKAGLERVRIPGRLEIFPGTPEIILDGAHNVAGVEALAVALSGLSPRPTTLVFAAMDDKDIETMAQLIAPHVHKVVAAPVPDTERTSGRERVEMAFDRVSIPVAPASSAGEALELALGMTLPVGRIVVTGSMYLVGALRPALAAVPA
jgi:dihydrofolate synthase / folylpolyglutamate synthase